MKPAGPVTTDIVLVGGGHAHVHVLAELARRSVPGARITLVTRDLLTPYSGMLPGHVAGLYSRDEIHIDLAKLGAATGTRVLHAEAVGLDRAAKRVLLAGRPAIAYDLVSIDVGITPALASVAGAAEHAVAVKPIGSFLAKLEALERQVVRPDGPRRIAVIGGGAGGVELLLSLRTRLTARVDAPLEFTLVTDGEILATHNPRVRAAFRRVLAERGVALHEHTRVAAVEPAAIRAEDGRAIAADAVLMTTDAAAPAWFRDTGLDLDAKGFLAVGPSLQSTGDPDVFAAGDCAALVASPREKAGVYAVRAGPPLARNLRARASGQALRPWTPQRRHLALISTGGRYAVASRGGFKAEGAWLWRAKDWIDRRWMRMYRDIDRMLARMPPPAPAPATSDAEAMRCGGCAAKVGAGPLSRALARLPRSTVPGALAAPELPEDAAVLPPPAPDRHLVQTVDFFRAFVDDPFLFGEIAANHALTDVFAMGGVPLHALAVAAIPPGPADKVEEELFQLLAGARACLDREGVALVGGHTSEGAELALGFSVTGSVAPAEVRRKSGLGDGDVLILTKPLGTGVLFAAAMRGRAPAASIERAIASMRRSARRAAEILVAHGATAMTDVTGFGLCGHLGEMLAASGAEAALALDKVPLLPDALALARAGIASTLLPANLELGGLVDGAADAATRALLFDPQTAGGLLAGLPRARAEACTEALAAAGYEAAIVGRVLRTGLDAPAVRIRVEGSFAQRS